MRLKRFLDRRFKVLAWLRLIRLPNLLTVPGDTLAGFLLAAGSSALNWPRFFLLALPASLGFYTAGVILNDIFDFKEDHRDRPRRPLPKGDISRENAGMAALFLIGFAAFAAAFFDAMYVAAPLIVCIGLYNIGLKRVPVLGPVLMGLCRAGNLLLGAALSAHGVAFPTPALAGAAVLGLYIATVTQLARGEARPGARFTPRHIGQLLRMLIPLQTLLCLAAFPQFPRNLLGLLLLALLPLHRRLSRRYPPS
ncbi:MAG: UbiA family prenyltransferase [Lentisphaerae bacterium]|nr:UbiA family prenyltransferase [Lentisphaerota bacterium]